MKKLILLALIFLGGISFAGAQNHKGLTAKNNKNLAVKAQIEADLNDGSDEIEINVGEEDFEAIELSEIPKIITRAISKDFKNSTLSKAAVNAFGEYKIELSTFDDVQVTVFYEEPKVSPKNN